MTRKQFNAREFERSLVDAGYMPLNEYIRRWGEGYEKEKELSSRAYDFNQLDRCMDAVIRAYANNPQPNAAEPETNTGSSENNG
jgi:hypothetical protein